MIKNRVAPDAVASIQYSLPAYDAKVLTKNGDHARIEIEGQVYTLRVTRAGKLILTK